MSDSESNRNESEWRYYERNERNGLDDPKSYGNRKLTVSKRTYLVTKRFEESIRFSYANLVSLTTKSVTKGEDARGENEGEGEEEEIRSDV